ncbi:MAG: hypothetical protein Q4B54_07105, partial [Coriobacteriales bacterium]|nr:hypothetical protein [Coriobacteriales bacterium]
MKRQHMKRRQGELLLAIILGLVLTFGLGACGGQSSTSAATSEVATGESTDATQLDAAALENITVEPAGEPWANTSWSTSVPAEKPKATDDLYLSVAYDWLKEAKKTGESTAKLLSDTESLKNSLTKAVSDESVKCNGLEQLRIFYKQAADVESLTK